MESLFKKKYLSHSTAESPCLFTSVRSLRAGPAGRSVFASFPLAHKVWSDVQVTRKNSLANMFPLPKRLDLFRCKRSNSRQTCLVKAPHSLLINGANIVQSLHCLVDCGQGVASIFSTLHVLFTSTTGWSQECGSNQRTVSGV